MNWLFLALLSPALDTIVNFVDKYVVKHKLKDSYSIPVYSGFVAVIFGTIVWLCFGMPTMTGHNASLIITSGMVYAWANVLYFHALAKSQTSYIVALIQVIPVFILGLSYAILDEPLTAMQLVGFVLVLTSVLGLSVEKETKKLRLNKAFYQIIAADILYAISVVMIKFTVDLEGFVPILAYQGFGLALGSAALLLVSKRIGTAFLQSLRTAGKVTTAILFLNESLATFSQAVLFLAISIGPAALVSVLMGTQVFYAILYGVVLTLLFPKFFHEGVAKKEILSRIGLSTLLFVGVWLIGSSA